MSARVIDGKAIAARLREETAREVAAFRAALSSWFRLTPARFSSRRSPGPSEDGDASANQAWIASLLQLISRPLLSSSAKSSPVWGETSSRLRSPCITWSMRYYARCYGHRVHLHSANDVDAQLRRWLRTAYRVGNQEFIRR